MKTKRSTFDKQDLHGGKKNQVISSTSSDIAAKTEGKQKQHSDCDGACPINWKPVTVSR